jgi:hypothetical protein
MPDVRKGQAPPPIDREAFREKFQQSFVDPAFAVEQDAISRVLKQSPGARTRMAGRRR